MLFHIYLGGLNTPNRYWTITEVDETGKEITGYACKEVKINVSSWTLHLPDINRWVLVCKGTITGPLNDGQVKDCYEINRNQGDN